MGKKVDKALGRWGWKVGKKKLKKKTNIMKLMSWNLISW
jgi:hypothetical protein